MSTSSTARRLLQGSLAVVSAGVLVVSMGGWWTANHFDEQIQRTTVFSPTDDDPSPEARPTIDPRAGDSVNILVVGSDNRDGRSTEEQRRLGGPRLFVKRDDCTGLALGGNKARKLEFLLADALQRGAGAVGNRRTERH